MQMDSFMGLLETRRTEKKRQAPIRYLCGLKNGVDEMEDMIDERFLVWFGHIGKIIGLV